MAKTKCVLCMLLTLLICASCYNPWIAKILSLDIIFESNGGSMVESPTAYYGGKIPKPSNPVLDGFAFAGWYEDNGTFTRQWDFNAVVSKNMTLYAKWNPIQYAETFTVIFDSNGGSSVETEIVVSGGTVTRPANPTRSNYTFDNWYSDTALTAVYDFDTPVTANITLYAKWEPTHSHQWGEWTVTAAATETTDGVETRTCSVCGETETRFSGEYATGTAGLAYTLIGGGTAYSVKKGSVTSGAVHIPAYHRPDANSPYLPVTSIEYPAFSNCTSLTSITIPNSVTFIGEYAFEFCTSLTGITIPNSVTFIGEYAFDYCISLTSVTFEGMIASGSFASNAFDDDLYNKYVEGGPGTYIRSSNIWTKQP